MMTATSKRWFVASLCVGALLLAPSPALAVKFGINFQSDVFDPDHTVHQVDASVVGHGSAFGVPEADWIEPGVWDGLMPSSPFSTPAMNGASVNLAFSNYLLGRGYTNASMIGYGHPNHDPGVTGTQGAPTGEDAVLASFIFAISDDEAPGLGTDAHVTLTNLAAVAAAAGVPLNYKVTVFSTSEWVAENFTPAMITDNAAHSQLVEITPRPEFSRRWSTDATGNLLYYHGNAGRGDSEPIFTGDTLDISVDGRNEFLVGAERTYGRSNIAGVIVEFVPPSALVPEPSSIALLLGGAGVGLVAVLRRRAKLGRAVACLCVAALMVSQASAVSVGVNWGGNNFGFGPYSLTTGGPFGTPGYASAFGVAAGDWFEPGADPNSAGSAFSPATGGNLNIAWQSSLPDGGPDAPSTWTAYGWAHANMGLPYGSYANGDGFAGTPQNGDEAVLAGYLYGLSTAGGDPEDRPITVTISGLASVAAANAVPLSYRVHLMASSDYEAQYFTPGQVVDSSNNSETLNFNVLDFHPRWNYVLRSSGAKADSTTVFNGDSVTITINGPNEFNFVDSAEGDVNNDGVVDIFDVNVVSDNWGGTGPLGDANNDGIVDIFDVNVISDNWGNTGTGEILYGRTSLAGVTIEFIPGSATAVPEPSSLVIACLGIVGCGLAVVRRRGSLR